MIIEKKKEIWGGITTFLTMAYILVINPAILSTDGTGISFSGAVTATVLAAFFGTLLMGIYGKLPYALAPGMGLNAFFTYTLIFGEKINYQTALGIVFIAGLIFLILSVTPFRAILIRAIPAHLRSSLAIGIGIFLSFIGLKNMGIIADHPVTLVTFGKLHFENYISIISLFFAAYLSSKNNPFSFILSILFVTIGLFILGKVHMPEQLVSAPDFSLIGQFDVKSALKWSLFPALLSFLLADLFDTVSTFIGISKTANLLDENGDPKNLNRGLIVDSLATIFSGIIGTSPTTTYMESASGVNVGARTGFSAIITSICFLPFLFLAPIVGVISPLATGPVLVIVGSYMWKEAKSLNIDEIEDLLPAFITIIFIPLTFSIGKGLMWGFISHIVLYIMKGRYKEIHPILFIIGIISLAIQGYE